MAPGDRRRISPTLRPHELKLGSYPPSVKTTVSVKYPFRHHGPHGLQTAVGIQGQVSENSSR